MSSFPNTLKLASALLAGAALFAAPAVDACTTNAWNLTVGSPVAGGVAEDIKIYRGACSLRAANPGPSYVEESTNHSAEGADAPFTARFFVFTGVSGGSPVVFRALDQDVGGTTVIDVAYNTATQNFTFTVNGTSQSTAANTALLGKWVEVTLTYRATQPFAATTRSTGSSATTDLAGSVSGPTAGAAAIERVQLGMVAGGSGSGNIFVDEYEASRAATATPIPAMCRGDSNGDNDITAADRAAITAAIRGDLRAERVPDCNQDGDITAADRACVTGLIRAFRTCD